MGCGICGFVGTSDKNLLKDMCGSMRHRGPDSMGFYIDDGVGLAIDRLRIIDLVTGDQPIHNEDSTVWVVLNGEIYNYLELRSELEQLGHRFYTTGDTETIVHAYEAWGTKCLDRLRGMFAFALWDSRSRRLVLARDRFGKKPLHYALVDGVLLFGSEIKAILRYPPIDRSIDYIAMDYFFSYMYIPSPYTIFTQIRKLPPGHYGIFENGEFSTAQYWDLNFAPDDSLDEETAVDVLYHKIMDAVKIRLRSDVPLGAFLSGGIDSSVIVSMMRRQSKAAVKTVSIGFTQGSSEVRYSRMVAEFLDTDHKEYTVTPSAFEVLPRLVSHFDEPFADHSFIPTYYLSEVTRREVTVAMSGDGGDEMFMGYSFLTDPRSYGAYSKVPAGLRRPMLKGIRRLPGNSRLRRMADHAYEKDYGGQTAFERYAMRVTSMDGRGLDSLYSDEFKGKHSPINPYEYILGLTAEPGSSTPIDAINRATMKSYLSEGISTKVDRMSMAVSLEVRCPLLDQELFEVVRKIPSRMKLRGNQTKHIFKRMAVKYGLVPREIAYRRKQGFGAPLDDWMRGDWRELSAQALDPVIHGNYTGFFDPQRAKQWLSDPLVNANRIFSMIVFLQWYKMYVEEAWAPNSSVERA